MTCKVNRGGGPGAEGQILQVVKGLPVFTSCSCRSGTKRYNHARLTGKGNQMLKGKCWDGEEEILMCRCFGVAILVF